jgi:hypothetical protein
MLPGKKTIISDLFADNERPRSPNQVISLVADVCKQSLTASTYFSEIGSTNNHLHIAKSSTEGANKLSACKSCTCMEIEPILEVDP